MYWGSKCTGCASRTANGTGGTTSAHTCSGKYSQYSSCELLAQVPRDCITPAHHACLVHRHLGLPGARDYSWQLRHFAFACQKHGCLLSYRLKIAHPRLLPCVGNYSPALAARSSFLGAHALSRGCRGRRWILWRYSGHDLCDHLRHHVFVRLLDGFLQFGYIFTCHFCHCLLFSDSSLVCSVLPEHCAHSRTMASTILELGARRVRHRYIIVGCYGLHPSPSRC